ncbi:hypothetical protein GE107_21905 [Cohnella sp. CFH 77786]|uniref:hypothetical protein n=1 Tax=Cohnella sp. CFH 77786 TaxID=2662265 RepID=UPI001C60B12B|nr:hypothetical protein [Cohnella sp. CFH 77786]MBW5448703.1 hypothetical protein [Cohnella sp. CFH 77786]
MRIQRKRTKTVRSMLIAGALIGTIALAAGCNTAGNKAGMNNNGPRAQSYSDDGYLGMTNTYPRIPGRNMTLTYANDANLMRDAIRDVRGVAGANITFNGPEAYVTLKLDPGVDARRIPTVERQAASVLRFNFPRYVVHVSSMR